MDRPKIFQIPPEDQETLQHLANVLHLFQHRNHNQHRRSVWWRHYSTFRRQINGFMQELTRLNDKPTTHLARARKKARDPQTHEHIEHRLEFWQQTLVPKWRHAFSQVIADGRFAMLGLVLTAILAEVCRITGVTATFEDLGQAEVEKVLERFAKDGWENEDDSGPKSSSRIREDFGEVVSRDMDELNGGNEPVFEEPQHAATTPLHPALERPKKISKRDRDAVEIPTKKKKKRKKGGNAIDDLFSGF